MNIVECPEFRALLLFMRESLRDDEIPHRTKMRKSIIQEFQHYYGKLIEKLLVSLPLVFTLLSAHIDFDLEIGWQDIIHVRYLVQRRDVSFHGHHCPLVGTRD